MLSKFLENCRNMCAILMDSSVLSMQARTLEEVSAGIDFREDVIEKMRHKNWVIQVESVTPVINPTAHMQNVMLSELGHPAGSSARMFTKFTAFKPNTPYNEGSPQWYRDLCDVLKFPRECIPSHCINGESHPVSRALGL